jgi:hypothetical protein
MGVIPHRYTAREEHHLTTFLLKNFPAIPFPSFHGFPGIIIIHRPPAFLARLVSIKRRSPRW